MDAGLTGGADGSRPLPPEGRARWTLQMLADRLVALGCVEAVSDETVRVVLKQTS